MSKFLYPIYKLKTKSYIKWWLYHKKAGGLPKEYQRINYIRAETTAYIDSLIKVDNTFEINFKCKFINLPSNPYTENAILSNWLERINYWNFFIRGGSNYFDLYIKAHNNLEVAEINKDYNISIKQNDNNFNVIINDNIYNLNMSGSLLENPTTVKFFVRGDVNQQNATTGNCLGNIVIKNEQNKIVGNFIPCKRKKDNVIGMYDTITEKFFTKSGSGNLMEVD